eukprot:Hpha_TRINITY_DN18736_c0_g1::TRINITY_DN18736_c0_g1_i1::g.47578::m.47578
MAEIPVFVSTATSTLCVEVPGDGTVEDLMRLYARDIGKKDGGLPRLNYQGQRLDPAETLADAGVCPETTVQVETGLLWRLVGLENKEGAEYLDADELGFSEKISHDGAQFRGTESLGGEHEWEIVAYTAEEHYLYFIILNPPNEEEEEFPKAGGSYFTYCGKYHGWDTTGRAYGLDDKGKQSTSHNAFNEHRKELMHAKFRLDAPSGTFTCEVRLAKGMIDCSGEDGERRVKATKDWDEPKTLTRRLPPGRQWVPVFLLGSYGPLLRVTSIDGAKCSRGDIFADVNLDEW